MNNHNLFYDENNIIEHVSASVAMIPKGSPQNVRRRIGTSFDFLCFDQAKYLVNGLTKIWFLCRTNH